MKRPHAAPNVKNAREQSILEAEPRQHINTEDELDSKIDNAKGKNDANHFAQNFEENPESNTENGNSGAAHGAPITGGDSVAKLIHDTGFSCRSCGLGHRKDLSEKFFYHNVERTLAQGELDCKPFYFKIKQKRTLHSARFRTLTQKTNMKKTFEPLRAARTLLITEGEMSLLDYLFKNYVIFFKKSKIR